MSNAADVAAHNGTAGGACHAGRTVSGAADVAAHDGIIASACHAAVSGNATAHLSRWGVLLSDLLPLAHAAIRDRLVKGHGIATPRPFQIKTSYYIACPDLRLDIDVRQSGDGESGARRRRRT